MKARTREEMESLPPNKRWGLYAERVVCSRYRLQHETPDEDISDAVVVEESLLDHDPGTLVEVKSCRAVIETRRGPTQGRWWIGRESIESLAFERGLIALVVYQPDHPDGPVLRDTILPAESVIEDYIKRESACWTPNGSRHNNIDSESAQLGWYEVFSELSDPGPRWL